MHCYPLDDEATTRPNNYGDCHLNELWDKAKVKAYDCEYQMQALNWLKRNGVSLLITKTGTESGSHGKCDTYSVTIRVNKSESSSREILPKFYNSVVDSEKFIFLDAYSVLAYISMYVYSDYETVDDVYDELGEVKPSQAIAIFEEFNRINRYLHKYFTPDQLEALSEIN